MLVVYLSFSQRKRIGTKNWCRLHWLAYGVFAAMTVHGEMSDTDTIRPWVVGLYAAAVGSVTGAVAFRALAPQPRRAPRRAGEPAASA